MYIGIFEDMGSEYLRSGPFGTSEHRATLQRIRNVKGQKIRRNLEALPPFDAETVRAAWSHNLAIWAGTHIWPDANHRTGISVFFLVTARSLKIHLVLDPEAAEEMVRHSKSIRDRHYLDRGRYYTVEELADPDHPYRQVYAALEPSLLVVDAGVPRKD
ncbi:MAG: hypothetical protein KY455_08450 [Euryarchaeota archaeon]|nr:hypothetical protein [Euryarchaeota archaeon]